MVGNKCIRPVERLGRSSRLPRGVSNEAEFSPRRGPAEGSAEVASGEAEIACASRGLGGEPSSEAEFPPRLVWPRRGRTVVLGRGLSVHLGPSLMEWPWASKLRCRCCFEGRTRPRRLVLFCVFEGVLVPN